MSFQGKQATVDLRDGARAFVAAITARWSVETLLIGGDDPHRVVPGDLAPSIAAAMGMVGAISAGRKGNPNHDDPWGVIGNKWEGFTPQ